jgi:hypothetical protein
MLERQNTHIRMRVRIFVALGRRVSVGLDGVPAGLRRPALGHERHEGALGLQAMGCAWVHGGRRRAILISSVRGTSRRWSGVSPGPQRALEERRAAMRMCVATARHR